MSNCIVPDNETIAIMGLLHVVVIIRRRWKFCKVLWVRGLTCWGLVTPHGTGSTLDQVMACCLTPNHYLGQCSLTISKVPWHSSYQPSTNEWLKHDHSLFYTRWRLLSGYLAASLSTCYPVFNALAVKMNRYIWFWTIPNWSWNVLNTEMYFIENATALLLTADESFRCKPFWDRNPYIYVLPFFCGRASKSWSENRAPYPKLNQIIPPKALITITLFDMYNSYWSIVMFLNHHRI